MSQLLLGAVTMGYAAAGMFFLRFWSQTRDRLFLAFAAAFWLMGLVQAALAVLRQTFLQDYVAERYAFLYWVRLAAYCLIIIAVLDKNRPRRSRDSNP